MIELQRVVKNFNQQKILDNIDLSFTSNQNHVILGPSGVGKSTILKIICGQLTPDSGKVFVDGVDLSQAHNRTHYLKQMGFVYQKFNLLENMTVWDNIILPLKINKEKVNKDDVLSLIEEAGIKDQYLKYPNQLSGGQQQRVGIVRALVKNPKYLLCDEPTSALDSETSQKFVQTLKDITTHHKTTMIMVTHDLHVASEIATTIHRFDQQGITSYRNDLLREVI